MDEKNRKKGENVAYQIVDLYTGGEEVGFDPFGSYTGTPKKGDKVPVQDADDM